MYDSIQSDVVRIIAVGAHRVRFLGRVNPIVGEQAQVARLAPSSADHTRLCDVRLAVAYSGGGYGACAWRYAEPQICRWGGAAGEGARLLPCLARALHLPASQFGIGVSPTLGHPGIQI